MKDLLGVNVNEFLSPMAQLFIDIYTFDNDANMMQI